MAKIKYTATFEDGEVLKRSSARTYEACWRITHLPTGECRGTGFSGGYELAQKAAQTTVNRQCGVEYLTDRKPGRWGRSAQYRNYVEGIWAKHGGKAAYADLVAKRLAEYRIEIVDAVFAG